MISKQIINFAPTKDNKMARNNPKVAYLEEALSLSDKNILTLKNKRYGTGRKIQIVQFRRSA